MRLQNATRKTSLKVRSEHTKRLMVLIQLHTPISQFTMSSPSYSPLPKVESLDFWPDPSFPPAPHILNPIFSLAILKIIES